MRLNSEMNTNVVCIKVLIARVCVLTFLLWFRLRAGYPDPSVPVVHPSETAYPICEAAKRGDADIVAALIAKGVRVDVVGIRSSGGCGVGSLRKATPLAEALLAQYALFPCPPHSSTLSLHPLKFTIAHPLV